MRYASVFTLIKGNKKMIINTLRVNSGITRGEFRCIFTSLIPKIGIGKGVGTGTVTPRFKIDGRESRRELAKYIREKPRIHAKPKVT